MALARLSHALGEPFAQIVLSSVVVFALVGFVLAQYRAGTRNEKTLTRSVYTYARFAWNCFFKPHTGGKTRDQQVALESFYKAQASVYDATRTRLLKGREDMLGLVAAQLNNRVQNGTLPAKPVWVDIGGGTGYNIEAMQAFINVPEFFGAVYLVDFSPSLCAVAEDRFQRLGWKNVRVICADARHFRLEDYESQRLAALGLSPTNPTLTEKEGGTKAELITMSYSLSMIPEFYPVIDSTSGLLSPKGVIGVADFYVQSELDYQTRNYTGGEIDRHCMWISRVFWRTWFEADRVSLEAARRDYLEYRFGTITTFNGRCHLLGLRIPYYVWVGCSKDTGTTQVKLAQLNAAATESPFLSALDLQSKAVETAQNSSAIEIRSKAYESAIVNLAASLPLPAPWYQTHHWRIYYDDQLQKHRQFNDEYIYAFTWEDSRADARILNIQDDDVILAITSAGDNILSYAAQKPKRIHAVDLNPTQNHLLELKVAAFTSLPYPDFWKLFGEGKHPHFRELLLNKLSPHLSSLAFQYWLANGEKTFSGKGLYFTGCSRHALNMVQWMFGLLRLKDEITRMCSAPTVNEQKEIWLRSVRRVVLSRLLAWTVIGSKAWLWKALGVPQAQREMIEQDYIKQAEPLPTPPPSPEITVREKEDIVEHTKPREDIAQYGSGRAVWEYAINTLDPVVNNTLLSDNNHYYLLTLLGHYTQRCHPDYLSPKAHVKLSKPDAFDGLRIHTDEVGEVVERMTPSTLTIAVLMDSMDWFDPQSDAADVQIRKLNRALKVGGRVMVRSAGLDPWYVKRFEQLGFKAKCMARRVPGSCIDRVNMYASTWICTKTHSLQVDRSRGRGGDRSSTALEPLSIGEAMQQGGAIHLKSEN